MRSHSFVVTATVIVALTGCSKGDPGTPVPGQTTQPGVAPSCPPEVPVKIDRVSVDASAATATIRVDPDPRQISRNAGGVRWTLMSPPSKTYEFTTDGISFKPGAPPGPASPVVGKTQFVVCFGATTPDQTWPYTIKFVDTAAPTTVWVCDPTIVNRESIDLKAIEATVTCTKQP
jgi:hypothetical protein